MTMRIFTSQTLDTDANVYVGPFGEVAVGADGVLRIADNATPGGHTVSGTANTGDITFTGTAIGTTTNQDIALSTNGQNWYFAGNGGFSVPSSLPVTFTADLTPTYFRPHPGHTVLNLTGNAWTYSVSFAVDDYGHVHAFSNNTQTWPSNPGYVNGDAFVYGPNVTGIAGFNFTLYVSSIHNNGSEWTVTVQGQAPEVPASIASASVLKLSADGADWILSTDGNLTLPDDGYIQNYNGNITLLAAGNQPWTFGSDGVLTMPDGNLGNDGRIDFNFEGYNWGRISSHNRQVYIQSVASGDVDPDGTVYSEVSVGLDISISTNVQATNNNWTFGLDGTLTLPTSGNIVTTSGNLNITSTSGWVNITSGPHTFTFDADSVGRFIMPTQGVIAGNEDGVRVFAGNLATETGNVWTFGYGGTLEIPDKGIIRTQGWDSFSLQSDNTNITIIPNVDQTQGWTFGYNGILTLPRNNYLQTIDTNLTVGSQGTVRINSNAATGSGTYGWVFGADGSTPFPNGAKLNDGTSHQFATDNTVTTSLDLRDTTGRGFYTDTSGYTLRSSGSYNWVFGADGSLTFPNVNTRSGVGVGQIFDGPSWRAGLNMVGATDQSPIRIYNPGTDGKGFGASAVYIQHDNVQIITNNQNPGGPGYTWQFDKHSNLTLPAGGGITFGNGTQTQAYLGQNIFDQSLNSYDNVQFGNLLVTGNVTVNGNINISGNIQQISGNSASFYGDVNGIHALYAGLQLGASVVANPVIQSSASINDYVQNEFQNINGGNVASTDWVATANNGSDTTNYIDMGITSGGWDGTQANSLSNALLPDDGYLYVQGGTGGGNLVIGTASPGTALKIISGGADSSYIVAQFGAPGTDNAVTISGGLGVSGNVSAYNINAASITVGGQPVVGGTGPTGPTGVQGPTAPTGATGDTGPTGASGVLGPTGATGTIGPTGASGSPGPTGATGTIGPTGASGSPGPTGATGSTGTSGAAGPTGASGSAGATGATGATGVGATGPTGPTGALPAASFMRGSRSASQSGMSAGTRIVFTQVDASASSDISLNTSTGNITLAANSTYRLMALVPSWAGSRPAFGWYNETTGAYVGSLSESYQPTDGAGNGASGGISEYVFTPNVSTIVSYKLVSATATVTAGGNGDFALAGSYPWFEIQVIGAFIPALAGATGPTGPAGGGGTGNYGNANVAGYLSGNVSIGNLTVTGATNLGNIANVTITGGTTGQVLTTNGTGGLSFATPAGSYSNTNVAGYLSGNVTVGNLTVTTGFIQSTGNANITLDPAGTGVVSVASNIVATGSIVAGGVRSTTSATAPAAPTIGDIWYNTNNDTMYRWTTDGTSSFWLDYDGPTFSAPTATIASGFVNAGVYVVMDNLKATVTTGGNRGLSLSTVSGSNTYYIGGNYAVNGGSGGSSGSQAVTTSVATSSFGWNFTGAGDISTYILSDTTNFRSYRITLQIGGSYINNMISIERLY